MSKRVTNRELCEALEQERRLAQNYKRAVQEEKKKHRSTMMEIAQALDAILAAVVRACGEQQDDTITIRVEIPKVSKMIHPKVVRDAGGYTISIPADNKESDTG